MASKAHRTTSLVAAATLARIIPLDLRAKENLTLYDIKRGKQLQQLPDRQLQLRISPYRLPHPAFRTDIQYEEIENQEDVEKINNSLPKIFTDGSKIEGRVGGAVTCWINDQEERKTTFRLESYCSVYQAELYAILKSLQIMEKTPKYRKANILTDSKSALTAIADPDSLHPIVAEIREKIVEIQNRRAGKVVLYWVRAHKGTTGNERADHLAKQAALHNKTKTVCDAYPLSFAKHLLRANTLAAWEERYKAAATGAVTKKFFDSPATAYKTLKNFHMTNLRAQLFTGHGGFRAYLHKFALTEAPFCECDDETPETVEHILIECPIYTIMRLDCEFRMALPIEEESLQEAINNAKYRSHFMKFAEAMIKKAAQKNGSFVK